LLYGTRGLIALGGGAAAYAAAAAAEAASTAATRRTNDTKEMAFYHALPSTFWEEVV